VNQLSISKMPHIFTQHLSIQKDLKTFYLTYSRLNTRIVYQKAANEFLEFWRSSGHEIHEVGQLTRSHIDGWQRFMESKRDLSPTSICTKVAAILSFTRFLAEEDKIPKNVGEHVKLPKIPNSKVKTEAFSEDEIMFILEELRAKQLSATHPLHKKEDYRAWLHYGIFLTMATIGMRCSEIVNLKISDFVKTKDKYRLRLTIKGGEPHSPLVPEYLSDYLSLFIETCRKDLKKENSPIFAIEPGLSDNLCRDYISKLVSKIAKSHGIERKLSAHSLRVTTASLLHKKGVPIGEIQDLLGHSDIKTTLKYIKKTDEEKESASLKSPIQNLFNFKNAF
jgi:integrase/recombinase XerD